MRCVVTVDEVYLGSKIASYLRRKRTVSLFILPVFLLAVGTFLVFSVRGLSAQSAATRGEQLQQLYQLPPPSGAPEGKTEETVPTVERDQNDMGEIQVFQREEPHKFYQIYASQRFTLTDNAFLTLREESDFLSITQFGARYHPQKEFLQNFTIDVNGSLHRYSDFESLDFNNFRFSVRYNRAFTLGNLGRFQVFARAGYTRLEHANSIGSNNRGSGFLKQWFYNGGVQKVLPLSRWQYLYAGVSGRITDSKEVEGLGTGTFADPQRDSISPFLGYQYQYSRRIGFQANYRFSHSQYDFIRLGNQDREDDQHSINASVTYQMYEALDVNLTYSYTDNNSTSRIFEYEVNNGTVGGNLSWRF